MMRAYTGMEIGIQRGYRFRWFVLTESDAAIKAGISFSKQFNRLRTWLKKRLAGPFEYIIVEHEQGEILPGLNRRRRNWHILSYGSDRLPVEEIRAYWLAHFQSTVTGMAEVKDIQKSIRYLAGYLAAEDKFVKARMSHGWVFPGWISLTKSYKRAFGQYINRHDLTWLALLDPEQRKVELSWVMSTSA